MSPTRRKDSFDLEKLFDRVNRTCFGGQLAAPKMKWSARSSKSVMGKYNYTTDTLTINRLLNREDTPVYVIEFLIYHELLHKALGYQVINNRRRVHTPNFRKLERAFPRYQEANEYLTSLARSEHEKALTRKTEKTPQPRRKSFLERFLDALTR